MDKFNCLRIALINKDKKQKVKMLIPAFLDTLLPEIFTMGIPCDLSYCSIIFKMLSDKDKEAFSNIWYQTFFVWFRKVVENQDQLRAQILKNAEFAHELNTLNSKNGSVVNTHATATVNRNSLASERITEANVDTSPAAALPEPAVKSSQAPTATFSPVNVSVNNYEVKSSPQVMTENLSVEENDPWANAGNDPAFLTPDEIEKQKKDKERQEYLKTRKEFCPLPVLPLTHLDPDDPRNPVRTGNRYNETKHQKLFYDQRGMIFDGASADNESEYMPIPRLFQLNDDLPTWDNNVIYLYHYTLKEKDGSENFGSKNSREIYSFVISNFGPYMGQKCSFWFINKT